MFTLAIDSSLKQDRINLFDKICEMRGLVVSEMKDKYEIKGKNMSIENIVSLCINQKLAMNCDFEKNTIHVFLEEVIPVGKKIVEHPEIIKDSPVDLMAVPEENEMLLEDEPSFLDDENDPF